MKLYCDGELFGTLTGYTYDTPWAYAAIEPADPAAYTMLTQASYFVNTILEEGWGDLTLEEENQAYDRQLAQLGITEADVHRLQSSRWEIRESEHPDRQGFISLYECSPEGWMRWRW